MIFIFIDSKMDIFVVAKYIDKYDLMFNKDIIASEDNNTKIITEYIMDCLRKREEIIIKEEEPNVNYNEILLFSNLMPQDIQYEIMKKMVNFTSLMTYKYYCNEVVFDEVAKYHGNNKEEWLGNLFQNLTNAASMYELEEIIDVCNTNTVIHYKKWQKRLSYVTIGLSIVAIIITFVVSCYSFFKIYHYINLSLPTIYKYVNLGMDRLSTYYGGNVLTSFVYFTYNHMFKLMLVNIVANCTRLRNYRIMRCIDIYCSSLLRAWNAPLHIASYACTYVYDAGKYISGKINSLGMSMLTSYYNVGLESAKNNFIQGVINYHQ